MSELLEYGRKYNILFYYQVRDDKQRPLRFSTEHMMFQRLTEILVNSISSTAQSMWVPMAEQAINVVYSLGEHPDRICGILIKNMFKKIFNEEENSNNNEGKTS